MQDNKGKGRAVIQEEGDDGEIPLEFLNAIPPKEVAGNLLDEETSSHPYERKTKKFSDKIERSLQEFEEELERREERKSYDNKFIPFPGEKQDYSGKKPTIPREFNEDKTVNYPVIPTDLIAQILHFLIPTNQKEFKKFFQEGGNLKNLSNQLGTLREVNTAFLDFIDSKLAKTYRTLYDVDIFHRNWYNEWSLNIANDLVPPTPYPQAEKGIKYIQQMAELTLSELDPTLIKMILNEANKKNRIFRNLGGSITTKNPMNAIDLSHLIGRISMYRAPESPVTYTLHHATIPNPNDGETLQDAIMKDPIKYLDSIKEYLNTLVNSKRSNNQIIYGYIAFTSLLIIVSTPMLIVGALNFNKTNCVDLSTPRSEPSRDTGGHGRNRRFYISDQYEHVDSSTKQLFAQFNNCKISGNTLNEAKIKCLPNAQYFECMLNFCIQCLATKSKFTNIFLAGGIMECVAFVCCLLSMSCILSKCCKEMAKRFKKEKYSQFPHQNYLKKTIKDIDSLKKQLEDRLKEIKEVNQKSATNNTESEIQETEESVSSFAAIEQTRRSVTKITSASEQFDMV